MTTVSVREPVRGMQGSPSTSSRTVVSHGPYICSAAAWTSPGSGLGAGDRLPWSLGVAP
ncbi:hypothetical protein [Motilibacter aurantiacus]|uniref:hypothetical protein n=1 Tax=Motilibacter aurantiacus TaxID=2714955 RepID=UPI00140886CC|nr:hypothetical protein [Motilibacter aurantiacus]NHC47200.1 hypothetical protein [Motilibacter aurantiacus]